MCYQRYQRGAVLRRRDQVCTEVPIPKMLQDYHTRGVDLMEQAVIYYTIQHRSKKWWRHVFFYGMMVSAHNAYVIAKDKDHSHYRQQWPTLLDFLEDLADDLVGETRVDRALQLPRLPARPLQQCKTLLGRHESTEPCSCLGCQHAHCNSARPCWGDTSRQSPAAA